MKVLVLGGTQFVGWYIVKSLLEDGHTVTTLTRGSKKGIHGEKVTELYADRFNISELKNVLIGKLFDYVIDVSGYTREAVEIMYEALKNFKLKGYLFISSAAVYNKSETLPVKENFPKGNNDTWGIYATNKYEAEEFLLNKYLTNGFPFISIRPPYINGEGNNIYREAYIFDCLKESRPVIIPGKGDAKVQFIHIDDLYQTIIILFKTKSSGRCFNIGFNKSVTLREWVEACMDVYGKRTEIIKFNYKDSGFTPRDFFPFRDFPLFLDVDKISNIYSSKIPLHEGLKRSLDWYTHNEDKVDKKSSFFVNSQKIIKEII